MRFKKIKIEDTIYEANLDFRIALECDKIIHDNKIGDYEKYLAIIYTLFGEHGLDNKNHYSKLFNWALKYLSFGIDIKPSNKKPDMDYIKDKKYIASSFKYDYNYDPYKMEFLSWEDFFNDLNNLSNSEFGNCCVLNRIRQLRNYDLSKIKDEKEKQRIREAQKSVELNLDNKEEHKEFTKEEINNMENFYKQIGL